MIIKIKKVKKSKIPLFNPLISDGRFLYAVVPEKPLKKQSQQQSEQKVEEEKKGNDNDNDDDDEEEEQSYLYSIKCI